jgi:hypothetical protein
MPNNQHGSVSEKAPANANAPVSELRKASDELKAKIAEAKKRNDMPLDSALGNPKWENDAADGHLDVPDDDEN